MTEVPPIGICDDCGRRVVTGPLAGQSMIEVDAPGWMSDLEAVAYALRIAAESKYCSTCLQVYQ